VKFSEMAAQDDVYINDPPNCKKNCSAKPALPSRVITPSAGFKSREKLPSPLLKPVENKSLPNMYHRGNPHMSTGIEEAKSSPVHERKRCSDASYPKAEDLYLELDHLNGGPSLHHIPQEQKGMIYLKYDE